MHAPAIRLEKFTATEKLRLSSVLRRRILLLGSIYLFVITISVALIIFFNKYSTSFYFEDNLEVINVVFVIIAVICGRLLVAEIMDYNKEMKAPDKKVVETRVLARDGDKIMLGNKSFNESDFILGAPGFNAIRQGDNVRIEFSSKSRMLFSVRKL